MTSKIFISSGGDPLKDCPRDFDTADRWAKHANGDNTKFYHPVWSWDCGFKLDYDGPMLSVSSRFYPPKTHYGDKWDGSVQIVATGETVLKKQFECETLEQLRDDVESFVEGLKDKLSAKLSGVLEYKATDTLDTETLQQIHRICQIILGNRFGNDELDSLALMVGHHPLVLNAHNIPEEEP